MADQLRFDKAATMERVGDNTELLSELVELVKEEIASSLPRMRSLIDKGDAGLLEEAAHSLKGALGNVGAMTTYDLARKIEKLAQDGNAAEAGVLVQQLEKEFAAYLLEVRPLLLSR